jgi:hypothetical protein
MVRILTVRLVLACAGVALVGQTAQAGLITYTESARVAPATVYADHTTSSGIHLLPEPRTLTLFGSTFLVPVGLETFSNALPGHPASFTDRPFRFTLSIRDKTYNVLGTATFSGVFDGTLSRSNANLHVDFTSPTLRTLHLGHDLYNISVGQVSLGAPGGPAGAIGVTIATHHNPEPASLLLAALALPALGLARYPWRRARRAA